MVSGQLAVCVGTTADSGCTIGLRGRVMYEDTAGDLAYTQESTICSDSRYIKNSEGDAT